MEPTNHPFRKENALPNLHDYVPWRNTKQHIDIFPFSCSMQMVMESWNHDFVGGVSIFFFSSNSQMWHLWFSEGKSMGKFFIPSNPNWLTGLKLFWKGNGNDSYKKGEQVEKQGLSEKAWCGPQCRKKKKVKRAGPAEVFGCLRCRGNIRGCAACRKPQFQGRRFSSRHEWNEFMESKNKKKHHGWEIRMARGACCEKTWHAWGSTFFLHEAAAGARFPIPTRKADFCVEHFNRRKMIPSLKQTYPLNSGFPPKK